MTPAEGVCTRADGIVAWVRDNGDIVAAGLPVARTNSGGEY
ncbi:MAG TPA: hypothetical protein VFE19_00675 [Jatrophihabitantaceae bacterium]|nr:hypothetical protein [Jatrophihabitantaceae bacterium]